MVNGTITAAKAYFLGVIVFGKSTKFKYLVNKGCDELKWKMSESEKIVKK